VDELTVERFKPTMCADGPSRRRAGVASIFRATRIYRAAGALACAVCVAAALPAPSGATTKPPKPPKAQKAKPKKRAPAPAPATPAKGPIHFDQAPAIVGGDAAQVGTTLTAQAGTWHGPHKTVTTYQWWHCPSATSDNRCLIVSEGASDYLPSAADESQYLFLVMYARHNYDAAYAISRATAPVAAAPTATPRFEANPKPVPVTNLGAVLNPPADPKILDPFPIVRIKGWLTLNGARVTLFSVRAPLHVRITVTCAGPGCPTTPWRRTADLRTLTRISPFEHTLPAGMRITVTVTRPGYIGKRSVFWILRGKVPRRSDGCLSPTGRSIHCPEGV
jgi:hypothetical protein